MGKRVILGGVLAGILVFNWGFLAHMVLPLGETGVNMLPDEQAVMDSIKSTVKESGLYYFPGMKSMKEASESEMAAWTAKVKQGPVGILVVQTQGSEGITPRLLLTELGTNIASALLAALVLSQVRVNSTFLTRVGIVTLLGIFAFVTVHVPNWNWYSYPTDYIAAKAVEHTVGWFLAGLVLAAIVRAPRVKSDD